MNRLPSFKRKSFRIQGARNEALDVARGRVVLVSACFALAYILVVARVFDLSVIQGRLYNTGEPTEIVEMTAQEQAYRGDILDRNGVILATSLETASLYADPKLIIEPTETAKALARIFPDLAYGDILKSLQKDGRFVWLKRNLTPAEQYDVLQIGDPGLGFKTGRRRIYPNGDLAAHFVGYTDVDGRGLAGVERSFNTYLAAGGQPLVMTLDVRMQHILRREIVKAVENFTAKGGAGVIMDVTNGEVLAAVSYPDFDPHNLDVKNDAAMFNRLSLGTYEMGSTFKIFSTAAVLELAGAEMSDKYDAREPLQAGRFKINDYHAEKRVLTLPEVFMYSSNIGSALMGQKVGTEALQAFYRDLGLMDKITLEIDEVGRPILPAVWRDVNTLTASYGHGIAVTPLQMVAAAASIVGDGTLVKPTLIKNNDELLTQKGHADEPVIRIVSPQTAHRMRQLMRLVVTDGTGGNADVKGYRVGGKTGTAEKNINGRYDHKKLISSFLGFFPMEAPRYAVFVMVDEPKGNKQSYGYATAGWVAAPAVGKVVESMAPMVGIEPVMSAPEDDLSASLKRYVKTEEEIKAEKAVQNASY